MKYKMNIFGSTWEIRDTVEESKVICQGPLPNDPKSGFSLFASLHTALEKKTDEEVQVVMKEWSA